VILANATALAMQALWLVFGFERAPGSRYLPARRWFAAVWAGQALLFLDEIRAGLDLGLPAMLLLGSGTVGSWIAVWRITAANRPSGSEQATRTPPTDVVR
jgi:hypothetical protein